MDCSSNRLQILASTIDKILVHVNHRHYMYRLKHPCRNDTPGIAGGNTESDIRDTAYLFEDNGFHTLHKFLTFENDTDNIREQNPFLVLKWEKRASHFSQNTAIWSPILLRK